MTEQAQHDWFSPVGDSVLAAMRRRGVEADSLSQALQGGRDELRAILAGQTDIGDRTATILARILGGTAAFWTTRQKNFEEALGRSIDALNEKESEVWLGTIPIPTRRRLTKSNRKEELQRRLRYYGVSSLSGWQRRYVLDRTATRFRSSTSFTSDEGSLSLWLRSGELEAAMVDTKSWDAKRLSELLPEIRALSRFGNPSVFVPKLQSLLAKAGVAFVFVRAPNGCRASGASRMVAADKAMLLVSFRHRSDDQFWFTVFHEIGHLVLHGAEPFVDLDGGDADDRFEREANAFAEELVVPKKMQPELTGLPNRKKEIVSFAKRVGVSPGLILGQMQFKGLAPFSRSSRLQRTWTWNDIEAAFES